MPEADPGIPELPEGWATAAPWREAAAAEYELMGPILRDMGLLSEIDRAAFLEYCDAWGRKEYWTRRVAEDGAVQVTESGYEAQRPAVTFMNRASDDLKKYLGLFGLSPSDRTRVSASAPAKKKDPTEKFFDGPRLAG